MGNPGRSDGDGRYSEGAWHLLSWLHSPRLLDRFRELESFSAEDQ